jgi:hypothetical protein
VLGLVVENLRKTVWSGFVRVAVAPLNWAHNLNVGGSNPPPATNLNLDITYFVEMLTDLANNQ